MGSCKYLCLTHVLQADCQQTSLPRLLEQPPTAMMNMKESSLTLMIGRILTLLHNLRISS